MFGCNWGSPFPYNVVGILINILMLVTIIYIITLTVRSFLARDVARRDTADSMDIIRAKFARGEITEEEFQRMRDILTG